MICLQFSRSLFYLTRAFSLFYTLNLSLHHGFALVAVLAASCLCVFVLCARLTFLVISFLLVGTVSSTLVPFKKRQDTWLGPSKS